MQAAKRPRIGYVVNAYPVVSETFLVSELRGVEQSGLAIGILALSRRQDAISPHGVESIKAPVWRPRRALPFGWIGAAVDHGRALAARPGPYCRLVEHDLLRPLGRAVRALGKRRARRALRRRWRLFFLAPVVAARAKRSGIEHLHAHYAKEPLEVAARVSWLTGIPHSFAAHAKDLYTTPRNRLSRRLAKAKFAITCHPHGHRSLQEIARQEDRSKVHLIPHGIDQSLFREGAASQRQQRLIVAAGRLTPKKGFDTLIEACARLQRTADFDCVIIGDGRQRDRLQRLIDKRGLSSRVSLLGMVDQAGLADWFQRAEVVAVPARVLESGNRDGIPNVLLEAMACGAPVVTTPVGSIGELVVDGVNGRVVSPEDPKQLATALAKSFRYPDKARRMACRALADVGALDYRASGRRVAKLFRRRFAGDEDSVEARFRVPEIDTERMVKAARRRLGREPSIDVEVEETIAASVSPGLKANAWRPDLQKLAERRIWDEVAKAPRAGEVRDFIGGMGFRLDPSKRLLDVGCGRGGVSVALLASGLEVTSLDLRLRNCHVSRLRGRRYGMPVKALAGRAEELPFDDRTFDVVLLLEVLEHVADPAALLREARRVCGPRGLCVVTVVNRWAHLDPHYRMWGINFLPRSVAEWVISSRGRTKRSWQDNQRLVDMHYFSYRGFTRFARTVGFEVRDPQEVAGRSRSVRHWLSRTISLGFNTLTLVLEPVHERAVLDSPIATT